MNMAKAQGIFMRKHRNETLYSAQLISINTKVNDQKKKINSSLKFREAMIKTIVHHRVTHEQSKPLKGHVFLKLWADNLLLSWS